MQTTINIFTIIGSLFGIISFFINIFSSIHTYNQKKWEHLSSIINFHDLEELYRCVSEGNIYQKDLNKFNVFTHLIRVNSEEFQFKGFAKKKIQIILKNILIEEEKFKNEIQCPKWEWGKGHNEDIEDGIRIINQEYFQLKYHHSNVECEKKIDESICNAMNSIEEIKKLHRKIHCISNKLPYELLYEKFHLVNTNLSSVDN